MELFKHMHVFVEVAKACSFRRAAEVLDMPNSTVSRRISELEQEMGLRLFKRSTRKVELTESGQIYFEHCRRIMQEAQLAYEEVTRIQSRPSGVIRASLPVDFSLFYLSGILADFSRLYPDIQFELDLTPRSANLLAEPVDLAIRMGQPREQNLNATLIARLSRGLYASPDYLRQRGVPAQPADLLAHECLRINNRPWILTDTQQQTASVPLHGRFLANNPGLLRQLAVNGMGIVLLAEELIGSDIAENKLVRVLPEWVSAPVPVYALTETRLLPAKVQVFLDYLVSQLAHIN